VSQRISFEGTSASSQSRFPSARFDKAPQAVILAAAEVRMAAEGGGASPEDVRRLTHASLGEANDLYRRVPQQWPRLCQAVKAVRIAPPAAEVSQSSGEAATSRGMSRILPTFRRTGRSRH
jgi:hypothetical protein